jgi:hypothetical protein
MMRECIKGEVYRSGHDRLSLAIEAVMHDTCGHMMSRCPATISEMQPEGDWRIVWPVDKKEAR